MRGYPRLVAAALLLSLPALLQAERLALVGGTLIDGFGGPPIRNSVILIEGERITAVGTVGSLEVPADARVIPTEGMSVMPGLWDMHVHLMINGHADYDHWDKTYAPVFRSIIMPASAKQLLMAGVTGARELGGPLEDLLDVRERIRKGEIPGPTLFISGPFLQHRPYPGEEEYRWGIYGVDDARAKVQKLAAAGVDCIKLIDQDQMTLEEVEAIVTEAHKHNLPVVAHAHRPEEIRRGFQFGVDCFEHTGLATAPEYPADIVALMRERTAQMNKGPMFWCPTASGLLNFENLRDDPESLDDPSWHDGLPPEIVADIKQSLSKLDRIGYFQITPNRRPTLATKISQLREAGLVLLIGTDSGIPTVFHSQSTWRELDSWANGFGIPMMEAIRGATYWAAVSMRADKDYGSVSEGKYADIIAVRGDVLRYPNLLRDVKLVVKHGRQVK